MMCAMLALPVAAQVGEATLNSQYQTAIREFLRQDIEARQKRMQKQARQMLIELPNSEKLYDETFISIQTRLEEGLTEERTPELNYVFDISYNCRHMESVTDDYPVGAYVWDSSNSCRAICTLIKTFVEGELKSIFSAGKAVTVSIFSTADGAEILKPLHYGGEYGDFRYMPTVFNNEQLRISVSPESGIANNAQLAYLRAQSVKWFLEHNVRNLQRTVNDFRFITRSYADTGSHYRRSSVELTVHDAFRETIDQMTADKIQDDYVDFNIPRSSRSFDNGYVLIIANEEYDDAFLPDVPYASNDGEILRQYFVKAVGVPERQVKVIGNATREEILNEGVHWLTDLCQAVSVRDAAGNVTPQAELYVYYAGHGFRDFDDVAYIVPNRIDASGIKTLQGGKKKGCCKKKSAAASGTAKYDISLGRKESAKLASQLIGVDELCNLFKGQPVKNLTLIFDAGFNGTQRNGQPMLRPDKKADPKARKKKSRMRSDAVVLLGADYDKTVYSFDAQHHGFLTYFLLKEVKGIAAELDEHTYQDIFEAVERKVSKESALQGKLQEPTGVAGGIYQTTWGARKIR